MRVYAYSLDDRIESQDIDESEANAKKRINKTTIAYTTVDLYTGDNTISTNMFDSFMNLETIILPNSVTQMTGTPFYNCPKLKTVVIGQLLYKIAHGRIAIDCPNLSVNLNDNQYLKNENGVIYNYNYSELLMTLPNTTLPSFITIDSRTQSINPKSFYQHNEIKQIYMHEGLTTIGYMAFAGCESLLGIAIPSTVQTMKAAYKDCKSIQKVSIPESLFRIEASTFSGCESLMTITIPPTIESIDQYAFYGCKRLSVVQIGSQIVHTIRKYAFSGCESLIDINIPNTITKISGYAFSGCSKLADFSFHENLSILEEGAFYGCNFETIDLSKTTIESLTGRSITYLGSIRSIHESPFGNCLQLKKIYLPHTLHSLEKAVFDSPLLTDIYCYATEPPTAFEDEEKPQYPDVRHIYDGSFKDINTNTCRLHVPLNSIDKYKKAVCWRLFYNTDNIIETEVINASDPLQEFIDQIPTNDNEFVYVIPISNDGFDMNSDVNVDNLQIIIDGIGNNNSSKFYFNGGIFSISSSASVTFRNVVFQGSNGSISNQGIMKIQNEKDETSPIASPGGSVTNMGKIYWGRGASISNIVNLLGGRLYVMGEMNTSMNIIIPSENDIEPGAAIVTGSDGYTLTAEDATHVSFSLPEGYKAHYDTAMAGIVISFSDGIRTVNHSNQIIHGNIYDVQGRKLTNGITTKGTYIIDKKKIVLK